MCITRNVMNKALVVFIGVDGDGAAPLPIGVRCGVGVRLELPERLQGGFGISQSCTGNKLHPERNGWASIRVLLM